MKLIKSTLENVSVIMDIINDAQKYLASLGIDQWQDGYPDETQIKKDISNDDSYVITNSHGEIIGTTVFSIKKDPTYDVIKGEWSTSVNAIYGVIHRMAVFNKNRGEGIAQFVFKECHRILRTMNVNSLRIDTHRENKGKQNLLKKYNYKYCGVIYITNGDERLAYELVFNE